MFNINTVILIINETNTYSNMIVSSQANISKLLNEYLSVQNFN